MKISHKLIALGLAFSLLGGTSAFARPAPYFENGKTVEAHVPAAKTSGVTSYARRPTANTVKDNWPANMILG
jgi:hypothetical protein